MSSHYNDWFFSTGQYLLNDPSVEWLPIPGFPDYFICREGYVASLKNNTMRILTLHRGDRRGHLNVRLQKDGRTYEMYIHRLLAMVFKKNPDNLPVVRHLDDDPDNNDLDNLEWGTQRDNHYDSVRNGTYRPVSPEDREKGVAPLRKPVIATKISTGEETYYRGVSIAARELGIQEANLCKVLAGTRSHTCGYSFRYAKKDGE